jgi:hypothetical protein
MSSRPSMFIGSSVEGLPIAQALQAELEHDVDSTIWSQGPFGLSEGTLEALVAAVYEYDFAVLVLTPDDLIVERGATSGAPRDNVVFEAGLFMGALGRRRTFLVAPRNVDLRLPSDLAGITIAQFNQREDGNIRAAIGPVAVNIRIAIEIGVKRPTSSSAEPTALSGIAAAEATPETSAPDAAVTAPSSDLVRLLEGVDQLLEVLQPAKPGGRLGGEHARLYAALLRSIRTERPGDLLLGALSEPKETAISGVFQMSNGEARTGLSIMRSALLSAPQRDPAAIR